MMHEVHVASCKPGEGHGCASFFGHARQAVGSTKPGGRRASAGLSALSLGLGTCVTQPCVLYYVVLIACSESAKFTLS
jgi:hypothetical protein